MHQKHPPAKVVFSHGVVDGIFSPLAEIKDENRKIIVIASEAKQSLKELILLGLPRRLRLLAMTFSIAPSI
jgi:hypothetical protein